MHLPLVITAIFVLLVSCGAKDAAPNQAQRFVSSGRLFAGEHRYAEARIAFEKALALDSLNALAHYELGNLDAQLGRLEAAVGSYEAALAADPTFDDARHNLAVIEADRGHLPRAVALLEQLPRHAIALETLALFYAKQGRYDRAEAALKAALEIADRGDARRQLGQLYLRQGQLDQALTALDHALALDSTDVESRRLRGLAHFAARRWQQAHSDFVAALAHDPHLIEAHYNLSTALAALGREKEAQAALARFEELSDHAAQITRLRRQLDADPNHLATRLELAHHHRRLGQDDMAFTHYHMALIDHPAALDALVQLTSMLLDRGKKEEVLKLVRRGVARHPDDPRSARLYAARGYIHLRQGQYAAARTAFSDALALDSTTAKTWNNLGNAHLGLGDRVPARRALERALTADPSLADAHYNLGGLHLQDGRLDQALQAYLAALAADSTFVRTYYALATVHQTLGDIADARRAYQTFIDRWRGDPTFADQARQRLAELP